MNYLNLSVCWSKFNSSIWFTFQFAQNLPPKFEFAKSFVNVNWDAIHCMLSNCFDCWVFNLKFQFKKNSILIWIFNNFFFFHLISNQFIIIVILIHSFQINFCKISIEIFDFHYFIILNVSFLIFPDSLFFSNKHRFTLHFNCICIINSKTLSLRLSAKCFEDRYSLSNSIIRIFDSNEWDQIQKTIQLNNDSRCNDISNDRFQRLLSNDTFEKNGYAQ